MKKKKIHLSVTEFALPCPRKGSIEAHSGYGRSSTLGIELHQKIQLERMTDHPEYKAEVPTSHVFELEEYIFEISGRMDGIFEHEHLPKIEEIKSTFNIYDLSRKLKEAGDEHPYCLQLLTYGYFHWMRTKVLPDLSLHLVSTRNGESLNLGLKLNIETYEKWMNLRLAELMEEVRLAEKRNKRRKKAASEFKFPFEKPRSGQVELIDSIFEGMKENRPMLIQAPTGLGKTVGVMYPTLQEALKRGQRLVYLTPKNSQHSVAEDAIDRLQETGSAVKSMTLTAKSKMCMKNEPLCNPDYCEYAKDHYTKVAENKLIEQLSKKRSLKAKTFKKMADEYQVCPFELQLDAAQDVDTVICDYNYVFSPRSTFGRLSNPGLISEGKPNLVIDEAHNLPSRAMDSYSPSLSVFVLERMREPLNRIPGKFRRDAMELLNDCISVVKACAPSLDLQKPCQIQPPVDSFLTQDADLRAFLSSYLNSDIEIQPRDPVMQLCFYWSEFTAALEFVGGEHKPFFTTFHPHPATVKITCCDASEMLKDCYKDYSQVVAFSATLKPFDFYSQLSGLTQDELKTAEFVSPFPKSNRKLLIIPQISSKYSERERNYPRISETIQKIASLKRGNYIAFFPSFDFMERVLSLMKPPEGFQILRQERNMKREEIQVVLETLKIPGAGHILFAVQGGVFSEGVDYPGEMVIGAFVVGPPLPNFDLEREKMREYYEDHYSAGFDYAYTYPAMAKAVQAAGRVIRSERDRGLIVLMDNRFIQPSFSKSMPQDWFEETPREAVSDQILQDVTNFWDSHQKNNLSTDLSEPSSAQK